MITFDENVAHRFPDLCIAYTVVRGVKVERLKKKHIMDFEYAIQKLKAKYSLEELKSNPIIRAYRDFYWRLDIDPTKQRPSSEAFLRRVLRKGFIYINNVVDSGNLASIETLVPIGLYDLDSLSPPLTVKFTKGGEKFKMLNGAELTLPKNQLVIVDKKGKIIHIYPHRDSGETKITNKTKNVFVVALGAPGISVDRVREAARLASLLIVRYAGGSFDEPAVLQAY